MTEDLNSSLIGAGEGAPEGAPPEGAPVNTPPVVPEQGVPPTTNTMQQAEALMNDGWKAFIPEDLKDRSEFTRVNTLQDLCKNYIAGQQTISKSVRIPDVNSTAEEINAFYTKIGKPAVKEDYTFDYTPQEGYSLNKDSFDFSQFQEIAERANLTKDQYQAMATAYLDVQNQTLNTYNSNLSAQAGAELKAAEEALRKEWGRDYASNINTISAKINQMYPQETVKKMEAVGLFRDADFLKSQLSLTKMMTGDTIFIEGRGVDNVPQTIEDLRGKRDALMQSDYLKNKAQVDELNKQIVQLQMAQSSQLSRR